MRYMVPATSVTAWAAANLVDKKKVVGPSWSWMQRWSESYIFKFNHHISYLPPDIARKYACSQLHLPHKDFVKGHQETSGLSILFSVLGPYYNWICILNCKPNFGNLSVWTFTLVFLIRNGYTEEASFFRREAFSGHLRPILLSLITPFPYPSVQDSNSGGSLYDYIFLDYYTDPLYICLQLFFHSFWLRYSYVY